MESQGGDDPFQTAPRPSAAGKTDADPALSTTIGMAGDSLASSANTSAAALAQIGDYQILSEIARGGMGVVYKARHRTLGRLAAVKLIKSGELAQAEEVQRFQVEAQAAAVLDHPGIVPVYEVGQQGAQHYLAMAYINGQSLAQRVKESPLTPHDAARIMQQVAAAVQYAHDQGIVHRDLKPQNILMTKDGQPKVTDFGLAKKQGSDSNLTATGQILGTPSFMPPEQTKGTSDQIGPLSDVYSLGATLYCLLTGRPPFQAATPLETMLQVANQEPVPLRQLNPSIPRDLETICLKGLQKNPSQRYASAGDFAADLGRYLVGEAIIARPIGRLEKAWRWCCKHPAGTALAASFVLLLGLAGVTVWLVQEQQRSRQIAQLTSSFESLLDRPAANPTYIEQGESLLAALALFAPAQSEQERSRLWQTYATVIEAGILQPKLSSDDEQRLGEALTKFSERDADEAARLQELLDGRRRSWRPLVELKAPFADVATIFPADEVELKAGRLVRRGDPQRSNAPRPVATNVTAAGKIRLEATFDANWKSAERLGVEFRYDEKNRYVFLLNADAPAVQLPEEPLAAEQRRNRRVQAQLLRNGVSLRSQDVNVSELSSESLRVDAQRDGDRLEFKVGSAEPMVFEDVFAIRSRDPAHFGLIWPPNVGLSDLTVSSMPVPKTTSPLEAGDVVFANGNFEDAARQYHESALVTTDESLRQEAHYKEGISLLTLGRTQDAERLFESLIGESGTRWPMLASIQLWVIQVRQRDHEQADATFELITGRYSFSELATLVPEELRQELLDVYRPEPMPRLLRVMTYDPKRIEKLERFVSLQDLFGSNEWERMGARSQLIDALWSAGKYDLASQLIVQADQRARDSNEHYVRFGPCFPLYLAWKFQRGEAQLALNELDQVMRAEATPWANEDGALWLVRAQCEAQLEQWDDALRSLDRALQLAVKHHGENGLRSWRDYNTAMEGFIHEKRGDSVRAMEIWRNSSDQGSGPADWANTSLTYMILRGLSGEIDRNDAEIFLSKIAGSEPGTLGAAARGFLSPDSLMVMAREMFRAPHGREIAWQISNGELFPSEQVEKIAALLLYEFVRQNAFEGSVSSEMHDEIWSTAQRVIRDRAQKGSFSALQIGQLGLSWKGTMNVLGWGGLGPSLPQELRSPGAYMIAHRMLRRSQSVEAAKLFSEALTYAQAGSKIAKFAQQDSELLQAGQGLAIVRNSGAKSVTVEIFSGEVVVQRIEVEKEMEVALPTGNYAWRIAELPDTRGQFTLSLCGRRIVELPAMP